jgi:hypothetical protein
MQVENKPALGERPDRAAICPEPHALNTRGTAAMKDLEQLALGSGSHRSFSS